MLFFSAYQSFCIYAAKRFLVEGKKTQNQVHGNTILGKEEEKQTHREELNRNAIVYECERSS